MSHQSIFQSFLALFIAYIPREGKATENTVSVPPHVAMQPHTVSLNYLLVVGVTAYLSPEHVSCSAISYEDFSHMISSQPPVKMITQNPRIGRKDRKYDLEKLQR